MSELKRKLSTLLLPVTPFRSDRFAIPILLLLGSSALLVLAAAWVMPPEYSWRLHSISEAAAQGQQQAWIARLAFLCFGAAVLLLAIVRRGTFPRLSYWCCLVFSGSMFGVAAFSHAPWHPGVASDVFEDCLHSLFASGMGLAFVIAVVACSLAREPNDYRGRILDVIAVVLATVLPMMLASTPSIGGLVQRVMFFVGYIWFGREALTHPRHRLLHS